MTADDVRARFEAWASDGGNCPKAVERTGYDDGYRLMATHLYWLAWQAAHADLAGDVRELVEALKLCASVCAGETMSKSGLVRALEAAQAALAKFTHQEKP